MVLHCCSAVQCRNHVCEISSIISVDILHKIKVKVMICNSILKEFKNSRAGQLLENFEPDITKWIFAEK